MASKIMVIISTAEKEKALTGIMYAVNSQKNKWVDDVKVVFFGPFENLICEDDDIITAASQLRCRACSTVLKTSVVPYFAAIWEASFLFVSHIPISTLVVFNMQRV